MTCKEKTSKHTKTLRLLQMEIFLNVKEGEREDSRGKNEGREGGILFP